MIDKDRVEQFILGSCHRDNYTLRYRLLLVGSMLMAGFIISFAASMLRFYANSYHLATVDLILSVTLFSLFIYLRRDKKSYKIISDLALMLLYVGFTAIIIYGEAEQTKLLWFMSLISAAYMINGINKGTKILFLVVATLFILYFIPFLEVKLESKDVMLAIGAYCAIALFMIFSELEKSEHINSIEDKIEEIDRQKRMLYIKARTIGLTNLPNKSVLEEDIKSFQGEISCIVMDIDDFDLIVHEFGDRFTDHLIIQVADSLKGLVSDNISLYHIYGKRFAFLIKNPIKNQDILFVENLKSTFERLKIGYEDIELAVNFIIAIVRDKSNTLSHASVTISEIKKSGKSNYKIYQYDAKKEEIQKNNLYWAKRLSILMQEDKIVVYYQPIVDNITCKVVKYECLVRAIDGDRVVTPYAFLSVAKSKGFLRKITEIVIDKSFKLFSQNSYDFSINITEQDLNEEYLVEYLSKKSKEYNIDPKRVFLEVLENINAEDSTYADEQFKMLRELGFSIAIDDFGAEASNLSRLLTLKADIIKIDGQFIKNLDNDEESIKIVETIVSLAKKMNVKTVAEFVHSEEIYQIVKKVGVDFSQGYYFSPPLPHITTPHIEKLEKITT